MKRVPLSQQKEFRIIKNTVIKEAENIRQCDLFFEGKGVEQAAEPEEFRNAYYDYENLRDAIRDESLTLEERGDAVDEMNELAKSGTSTRSICLVSCISWARAWSTAEPWVLIG